EAGRHADAIGMRDQAVGDLEPADRPVVALGRDVHPEAGDFAVVDPEVAIGARGDDAVAAGAVETVEADAADRDVRRLDDREAVGGGADSRLVAAAIGGDRGVALAPVAQARVPGVAAL